MSASENPTLSVVMPAFNEAQILASSVVTVIDGLQRRGVRFEVVVVENGSTDGTLDVARDIEAQHPEVRVESLGFADYGLALRAGLLDARGDIVVNFDVDYFDLGFLDTAVALLETPGGPAIVVGSKRAPGAADRRSPLRKLVTAVFSGLLRVVFGLRVSDTHGMKALRRADVEPLARECRFGQDLFDTELVLRAERAGLRTAETPVEVRELRPARTSILRRVPRALLGLARLRVALWSERAR
jgi:hypothetical protein